MKLSKLFTLALMAVSALAASAQGMEFMPEGSTLQDAIDKAAKEDKMVFLDCYTSWCGPCKMMHPELEKLHEMMGDQVRILKIDVDKNEALASKYMIRSVPTLMIFKNNKLEWRGAGVHTAQDLQRLLEAFING